MRKTLLAILGLLYLVLSQSAFADIRPVRSIRVVIPNSQIGAPDGYSFYFYLPRHHRCLPDTRGDMYASNGQLYENGYPLGPAHSLHADIANYGYGLFSHWGPNTGEAPYIRFSSSDGSDPRRNHRRYEFRCQPEFFDRG